MDDQRTHARRVRSIEDAVDRVEEQTSPQTPALGGFVHRQAGQRGHTPAIESRSEIAIDSDAAVVNGDALLFPEQTSQMMQSSMRDAEQSSWLSRWPGCRNSRPISEAQWQTLHERLDSTRRPFDRDQPSGVRHGRATKQIVGHPAGRSPSFFRRPNQALATASADLGQETLDFAAGRSGGLGTELRH